MDSALNLRPGAVGSFHLQKCHLGHNPLFHCATSFRLLLSECRSFSVVVVMFLIPLPEAQHLFWAGATPGDRWAQPPKVEIHNDGNSSLKILNNDLMFTMVEANVLSVISRVGADNMSGYGSDERGHGLPDQLDSSGIWGYNAHERICKTACERCCFRLPKRNSGT